MGKKHEQMRRYIIAVLNKHGKISTSSVCTNLIHMAGGFLIKNGFMEPTQNYLDLSPTYSSYAILDARIAVITNPVRRQLNTLYKAGKIGKELQHETAGLYRFKRAFWWNRD